ncbi:hypothetical protein [Paraherbaspirillum soli]|uniref:Uncharacterized protein n=1 Tax=Paraherbaspirillum soli TaxID=631222 RepID=A0ABW0MGV3_9BURK
MSIVRTRAVIDTVKALDPNTVGKQQMLDSTLAFARVNCKKQANAD